MNDDADSLSRLDDEPLEVSRIRDLLEEWVVANERHLQPRLRLVMLPAPPTLGLDDLLSKTCELTAEFPGTVQIGTALPTAVEGDALVPDKIDVVIPPRIVEGCDRYEFWGVAGFDRGGVPTLGLLLLLAGGPGAEAAEEEFGSLATASGRVYQTLPPTLARIDATTSPRNSWATQLFGWLRGSAWVQRREGYDSIELPFAASVELWRRLLYGTTPDGKVSPGEPAACGPAKYLMSWQEVLRALQLPNTQESQRRVRELNKRYEGPIILPQKGGQPKVNRDRLLPWWNQLEEQFRQKDQNQADREATVQGQHPYGAQGTVLPNLSGHVKKRRRKKNQS